MEIASNEQLVFEVAEKLKRGSDRVLTAREALVASYLMFDYNTNDIAEFLCRSKNTIKMHIKNIKKKCNCETQTKLGAVLQNFIKNNPLGV